MTVDRRTALKAGALAVLPAAALSRADPASAATGARVLVAAGDMNDLSATRATGAVAAARRPDLVLTVGDMQYPHGSLADYRARYDSTPWGRLKAITRPVPGHHEYETPGATGYFAYFGVPPWYAYDIGLGWRGYALNSHRDIAQQAAWLRRDLAAHPGARVVAAWSDPRWSSGRKHGPARTMQPLVDALHGRSGVLLSGHEHQYERFDVRDGLRPFVVGTGGSATYPFGAPAAGSRVRLSRVPGVLVLTLRAEGSHSWAFVDRSGRTRDSGSS